MCSAELADRAIAEAVRFVARLFRVSEDEALVNLANYAYDLYEGDKDKVREVIYANIAEENYHDLVGHLVHEITEATLIKFLFGRALPPEGNWEETAYYKISHPVACVMEIKYLLSAGQRELAKQRQKEYKLPDIVDKITAQCLPSSAREMDSRY